MSKFYYFVTGERKWAAYQAAFKTLTSNVDGHVRAATAWPDWSITTKVDARDVWQHVWRAVQCHKTQMSIYKNVSSLTEDDQKVIWGTGEFYRVFSLVNGGRASEHDLFEGASLILVTKSRNEIRKDNVAQTTPRWRRKSFAGSAIGSSTRSPSTWRACPADP